MPEFVAAIDQGTTSTRFMVFDHDGAQIARSQREHHQILPAAGWVEHDPVEIWRRARETVDEGLRGAGLTASDIAAVGIANQRETTVVWDRATGIPYTNAIVWQDTRTDRIVEEIEESGGGELVRRKAGVPPSTYFSAGKLRWILDNVDGVRAAADRGDALFGTIDSWLLWNLTGGPDGGQHLTDPTNASRTMLMSLETLQWDDELLALFDIPAAMLPAIRPSAGIFGRTRPRGPLGAEIPIGGIVGDQQAAMVGHSCFEAGEAKNTYGTGNFLLMNTGPKIVRSRHGLLTTVCCVFGEQPPTYALEGSIAVTGSAVQWLRDQLGVIDDAAQSETLAEQVDDVAGLCFVPAFSGLFAPYWRPDARGAIVGLSRFHTKAHLARATLESICYQTRDVVQAMRDDTGIALRELRVDGGVTANELCMQAQADILGIPISRAAITETTALGAACAAGLAVGFWESPKKLREHQATARCWTPSWSEERRETGYARWKKAVERAMDWV